MAEMEIEVGGEVAGVSTWNLGLYPPSRIEAPFEEGKNAPSSLCYVAWDVDKGKMSV